MKKEIDELRCINPANFQVNYIVTKGENDWTGLTGHLDKQMLKKYLPEPSNDTLIMFSGTKPLNKMILKALEDLGYTDEMIVKF
jgi:cytochrome-b5 reductase